MEPAAHDLPMVDVYLPMMKASALITAGELGLFEALSSGPLDVPALAQATASSERGIGDLARFLGTCGYLVRDGERYANTEQAQRWFTSKGQVDYAPGLRWTALSWQLMGTLTDAVKRGAPAMSLWAKMGEQPSWGPTFSRYMHAFAEHLGPELLAKVKLPAGAKRLLDLGGSHGLHSIAFVRAHPGLSAVLVDQASALTDTAARLSQQGLSERIQLRPGDLREVEWGEGYDAVLFLSVAHNQTAADNAQTFKRIARALKPGGVLVVHEYPADGSPYASAFALTLLTETGTQPWPQAAYEAWLAEAGFDTPVVTPLHPPEKGTLFTAVRR
jgi:ubiquinone/menaquinone biosynthesis C-methylase UbiE